MKSPSDPMKHGGRSGDVMASTETAGPAGSVSWRGWRWRKAVLPVVLLHFTDQPIDDVERVKVDPASSRVDGIERQVSADTLMLG